MLPLIQSEYFKNLVNGFPEGVIIFNVYGEAYVINRHAGRLLETEPEALMGQRWDAIFAPLDTLPEFLTYMEGAARSDDPRPPLAIRWAAQAGATRHLSCSTARIVDSGKIFGILLSLNDVTHIFEMHARETRMLEEKRAMARERARGLEHFSMAVAHQIRNPVMTIAGFSRLLQRKLPPEGAAQDLLDGILEGGKRLDDIVKAVSEYNTAHPRELEPVDVPDCLERARAMALGRLARQEDALAWSLEIAPGLVPGDETLLRRALAELLINALESLERAQVSQPAISLRGEAKAGRYHLAIHDNGPGPAPADLPYVFDPFFTTKAVGVGMGLTMAQRIAREHQGRLRLEMAPEGGCLAMLELPLATPANPPHEPA